MLLALVAIAAAMSRGLVEWGPPRPRPRLRSRPVEPTVPRDQIHFGTNTQPDGTVIQWTSQGRNWTRRIIGPDGTDTLMVGSG